MNDYVAGIGYGPGATGNLFPPEFYIFGIEWEPYTIVDALAIMRLLAVYTSLSWPFDIVREQIRHYPELTDLTDEILPFRTDLVYNNMTIVDDESLKYFDQYSEKTTLERWFEASDHIEKARPPLDLSWKEPDEDEDE